jgi:hypothetical protein
MFICLSIWSEIKVEEFALISEDVGNAEPLDLGYNLTSISANPSSNNTDMRIPKMNSTNSAIPVFVNELIPKLNLVSLNLVLGMIKQVADHEKYF